MEEVKKKKKKKKAPQQKSKTKKRNTSAVYVMPKPKFGSTIGVTLIMSLLAVIIIVMFMTFTISIDTVKSAQASSQTNFYRNLSVFNRQNQTPLEFEAMLPKLRSLINSAVSSKYEVKDVFIADAKGNVIYTTLDRDKGDEYVYHPSSPMPLRINLSSNYAASKYYVISVPVTRVSKTGGKSYNVYLAVPKPSSEYQNKIITQFLIFFAVILIISIIFMSILVKSITKPLDTMEKTVSQISKGDLSGRLEFTKYDEINRLASAYNTMANALQRLYSSLEAQVSDRTRELKGAYAELQSTQAMMVHSEKMKSLGELVAGIMHEINNPINFIYGNMTHLGNYSHDLIALIDEYTKYEASLKPNEKVQTDALKKSCDYDFLRTDMPDLIKSCKEGAERAKNIIQDLKSFSRMEEVSIKHVNLPAEIDTVLNILHNKIKNKAQVHKEYMTNVPMVEAFGGQLNQVFMNILDNAAGAIENTGDIWIRINTDASNKNLVVEIEDNGCGMDEETERKVFDPFFTTKPVGKGTGLGMSITYKIIKNHQGDIQVVSKKGIGTKFIVTIPLYMDRENLKAGAVQGG